MLRLTLTGYGVAHVFPGGGAVATTITYPILRRRGFGYWAFDALCLILMFEAMGVSAGPFVLLADYGVATAVAAIPLAAIFYPTLRFGAGAPRSVR